MVKIRIILFGMILFWTCSAVKSQEHLEPVDGILDSHNSRLDYYSKVREILLKGLTDSPEIRFVVVPSFTPENLLDIQFDKNLQKYFMVFHIVDKNIWFNKDCKNIQVIEYKKEINKKSSDLIKLLFKTAILKTKYPEPAIIDSDGTTHYVSRVDGENYYFIYNDMGLKSGTIWSPTAGSKMDRLVKTGLELIELTKNDDAKPIDLNDELSGKIESLINDLK